MWRRMTTPPCPRKRESRSTCIQRSRCCETPSTACHFRREHGIERMRPSMLSGRRHGTSRSRLRLHEGNWAELAHGDVVVALHGGGNWSTAPPAWDSPAPISPRRAERRAAAVGGPSRTPQRAGESIILAPLVDPEGNGAQPAPRPAPHLRGPRRIGRQSARFRRDRAPPIQRWRSRRPHSVRLLLLLSRGNDGGHPARSGCHLVRMGGWNGPSTPVPGLLYRPGQLSAGLQRSRGPSNTDPGLSHTSYGGHAVGVGSGAPRRWP